MGRIEIRSDREALIATHEAERKQMAAESARLRRTIRYLRRQVDVLKARLKKERAA